VAQGRRSATAIIASLLLALSVVPTAAADDADDLREEISETREAADRARDELDRLGDEIADTQVAQDDAATRLAVAEADLASVSAKLDARQSDLEAVQATLADAEARLAEAEAAHTQALTVAANAEDRAVRTSRLADQEQVELDRQAAVIYKHGRATEVSRWLVAVRSADTISDFGRTSRLLRDASAEQMRVIDRMSALRQRAEAASAKAQAARVQAELRADEAERERAEVADLVEAQQEIVASARRLADAQRAAVRRVESERAALAAQADRLTVAETRTASELEELEEAEARLERELQALLAKPKVSGPAPGMLMFPTAGRVGSRFGYRIHPIYGYARLHAGIDVGAPTGQVIVAAESGQVVRAGWCGGYGYCTVIAHGGGMATLYAHQSRLAVGVGAWVSMGQTIGYIGSTGLSTGPHLHFEVRINGSPTDPCAYLSEC
jgi:murein DD-endopeptidase MepM/ murein hydrolase activator NlpD